MRKSSGDWEDLGSVPCTTSGFVFELKKNMKCINNLKSAALLPGEQLKHCAPKSVFYLFAQC